MGSRKKRRKDPSSSEEDSSEEDKKKKRKHPKGKKKRKHEPSSSSSTDSSSESTDTEKKKRKKLKKKKKLKRLQKERTPETTDIPIELMAKSKNMAPMTKEEWEKKQSVVKRVYDEITGRHRLIKGDGEVIEEIVSKDRHKTINQQATRGDGNFFQAQVMSNAILKQ